MFSDRPLSFVVSTTEPSMAIAATMRIARILRDEKAIHNVAVVMPITPATGAI